MDISKSRGLKRLTEKARLRVNGKNGGEIHQQHCPADFEMRPEAGPNSFKYSNFQMTGGSP